MYWIMFGYVGMGSLLQRPHAGSRDGRQSVLFLGAAFILAMLIGFRYRVGADWNSYQAMFALASYLSLDQLFAIGDPGYQLLNWLAAHAGAGLWLVDLLCGIIFSWGLFRFARVQRDPWLAILVAIPYLVIVVAMGYSRQGVAIGVLMAGLAAVLQGASIARFAVYVLIAATFHRTAVIAFPLVALASSRNRLLTAVSVAAISYALYTAFLSDRISNLVTGYVLARYSSQGAAIRVALDVVPALLYLARRKAFGFSNQEEKIWRNFSYASIASAIALTSVSSSTAVDRVALYLIPLQLVILPSVPGVYLSRRIGRLMVILYSGMVQFTWLVFAAHAKYWVPYKFIFLRN